MVSTLEHHTIPPLYACYLLNSVNARRQATYIGSTPDPPRRIKQHNGLIAGGAYKTKSGRPWNMELIVHGFPSKLQALQFEWAWQNPHASRHLRAPPASATEPPKAHFPRTALSNRPLVKVQVLQLMLASPPWSSFNLEVTLFCKEAQAWWNEARRVGPVARTEGARRAWEKTAGSKGEQWGPWAKRIDRVRVSVVLDGVDGTRLSKGEVRVVEGRLEEAEDGAGKIAVHDGAFFDPHWSKWQARIANLEGSQSSCQLCRKYIDVHAHLDYLLCTVPTAPHAPSCAAIFHLPCLAQRFIARAAPVASTSAAQLPPLLPLDGHCPACKGAVHWQDLVRAAYRRQEEADGRGRKKPKRLVPLRGSQAAPSSSQAEVEEEEEERFELSDVGEDDDGDEAERSFAFEQERSWAQLSDDDELGVPFGGSGGHVEMDLDNAWEDDASSGILVFEPTPSPAPPTPQPRKAQDETPRPPPRAKKARSPVQQTLSNRSSKPGVASSSVARKAGKSATAPRKVYAVLTSSSESDGEGEEVEVAFRPVDLGGLATSSPEPEVAFEPVDLVTPTPTPEERGVVGEKGMEVVREREPEQEEAVAEVARPKARRLGPRKKEVEVVVLSDSD